MTFSKESHNDTTRVRGVSRESIMMSRGHSLEKLRALDRTGLERLKVEHGEEPTVLNQPLN